ncbi:precorrin-3B synthase [Thiohalorhabdus methylotrophus]|uniref:Precorrin-3B synthase n=1 Tax=Thiohalorhabdus methylotrophus TaxID=3242694 RepID=A0ABV4TV18_9GAMM
MATENGMTPRVREACPGVAAPMETADGLLLRLRHPIGGLDAGQARTVAEVARRHGSGQLELTSRGNLQLRGFTAAELPAARRRLEETGLTDADPRREAVRNVVAAPVADRDTEAVADVRAVAQDLSAAVTGRPALRELPAKVGLLVDGGGRARLDALAADLRLEAVATPEGLRYRLAAGGTARTAVVLGWVTEAEAVASAVRVLERFLALREGQAEPPRRLAEAVACFGAGPLVEAAGADAIAGSDPVASRPSIRYRDLLGPEPGGGWVGAAFPFGALTADQLDGLAELLDPEAGGSLRLTPWRAVLLVGARSGAGEALRALGAVTDGGDRRLALSACVGAPGCAAGSTATRSDARAMGEAAGVLLGAGGRLHVSGCDKGCGKPAHPAATLTAEEGRYTLRVAMGPEEVPLRSELTPEAARRWMAALARVVAEERQEEEQVEETMQRLGKAVLAARVASEVKDAG